MPATGKIRRDTTLAPWLCRPLLRRWNCEVRHYHLPWLCEAEEPEPWRPRTVLVSALIGTLSHVALDSLMHADITPWAPWSDGNALCGLISLQSLHLLCVAGIAGGGLAWVLRQWMCRKQGR